jgi:hypothetical protein
MNDAERDARWVRGMFTAIIVVVITCLLVRPLFIHFGMFRRGVLHRTGRNAAVPWLGFTRTLLGISAHETARMIKAGLAGMTVTTLFMIGAVALLKIRIPGLQRSAKHRKKAAGIEKTIRGSHRRSPGLRPAGMRWRHRQPAPGTGTRETICRAPVGH